MDLMKEPEFNREDWFRMTDEQKEEMVNNLIEYAQMEGDISYLVLSEIIVPQLLEEEEYEMADVINKILNKLKTSGL